MLSYARIPLIMRRLRRYFTLTPHELRAFQTKRLRALVKHCYAHVPYYHHLFNDEHICPDDIQTLDDLAKIPMTTKDDIRKTPVDTMTARNIDLSTCIVRRTSGTTGIPLTVYLGKQMEFVNNIRKIAIELNSGSKLRYRRVVSVPWVPKPSFVVQTLGRLGFYHTKNISPFDEPRQKLAQMIAFNPQTMFVLPSSASILAQELDKGGYEDLQLQLIFTGGEMLDAVTRKLVQDAFTAPVFHNYGATEVYRIYSECRDHAYHVQSDLNLVEVTQNGDPVATGEEGDVTITNLDNYAMPFLRYNIEDVGYLLADQCTCGCHFPLMNLTTGRKKDVITLNDGSTIPAHRLNTIVQHHMETLKQYQIIQTQPGHLHLHIVPGAGFTDSIIDDIYHAVNSQVGEMLELQIERVESIPRESSGKFRLFK